MIEVGNNQTLQSEVGRLSNLILKHASAAFVSTRKVDDEWERLNYSNRPDYDSAREEYDRFAAHFSSAGIEIHFLPENDETTLDSIYVRDASVLCSRGAIMCRMGKAARRTEPDALELAYKEIGMPIAGRISGEGLLEGGDVVWLDEETLLAGQGYRTNAEGIRQLRGIIGNSAEELFVVQLPHWRGPEDVFHLMSILSPVDVGKLLVYEPLLPAALHQYLLNRNFKLIMVPENEFESMGCNVLALAPGSCLMMSGNPITRARLEAAGISVTEYEGTEISTKGAGGPTCLTRPVFRDRV